MMNDNGEAMDQSVGHIRTQSGQIPEIGLVLGSGLGGFAGNIDHGVMIPYAEIPHMPRPTVPGHAGILAVGTVAGTTVACLRGRVHLYEGHSPASVTYGVRLLAALGCKVVLLTNAAGAVTAMAEPGDLMLLVDHINLTGHNPLVGEPSPAGPRFVDLCHAYDPYLAESAHQAARESGIRLKDGVYAAVTGPCYETPAEVRMLSAIGAHAVGMSTAQEVIALRALDVRVGAISLITNRAAGLPGAILDHEHVQRVAETSGQNLARLLTRWIELIKRDRLQPTGISA